MAKKGENIYKRKDGRWEGRYIKTYNPDGSAKYGYCYAKTYLEVKQKLNIAKAALLTNQEPTSTKKRRLSFYCEEWLKFNRTRVKESTYVKYNTIISKHINPYLGYCLIQNLSSLTVEQFSYDLLSVESLSPKTVKDILTVLNSVLKYVSKQLPQGLQKIDIVYPKEAKKEMRVLTREEQERFMSYLSQDMDEYKFGVLLALLTGVRIGELCALRWENISLKEKTIKITSTMQRIHNFSEQRECQTQIIITSPKSETSSRIIPLTDFALSLCRQREKTNQSAFVLTGEPNRFIEPRMLQYRLNKYVQDCNLEGVHFHTLRHTFATRCIEVDFELKSLSEILGHSSPRITLERYVHSSLETKRENMNKLALIGF